MEIKKAKKYGWSLIETDDYIVVIPETDSKPHGRKISEVDYDVRGLECTCGLILTTGEMRRIGGRVISSQYPKPILVHNSFSDNEEQASLDK